MSPLQPPGSLGPAGAVEKATDSAEEPVEDTADTVEETIADVDGLAGA